MSTLICSRCQKIYPAANPPTKCANCGGTISVAKPVAQVPTPKVPPVAIPKPVNVTSNRPCSRPNCLEHAVKSVKHFYDGKRIVMTPLTQTKDRDAQDLCAKHSGNYSGPEGWTLVNKLVMPSYISPPENVAPQSSDAGEGCIAIVLAIFVLAVFGFIGWQIIVWLAGMDWGSGNDGDGTIFRIPVRRWR